MEITFICLYSQGLVNNNASANIVFVIFKLSVKYRLTLLMALLLFWAGFLRSSETLCLNWSVSFVYFGINPIKFVSCFLLAN